MSKRLGLLYLGRLEEEKGFWILLEWIRSQDLKNLEVDFYIFWAGKYEEALLELTRDCPQIHFFGWKPLTEIESLCIDGKEYWDTENMSIAMPEKQLVTA